MSRVYEDVIAAVDLRKGLLVDMDSEEFKKAEYDNLHPVIAQEYRHIMEDSPIPEIEVCDLL